MEETFSLLVYFEKLLGKKRMTITGFSAAGPHRPVEEEV